MLSSHKSLRPERGGAEQSTAGAGIASVNNAGSSNDDDDVDFFPFLAKETDHQSTPQEVAEDEILRFSLSESKDVASLHLFPHIKALFCRVNTPLPSSAAVERLFSLSGIVFASKRARLTDKNMENQVLLKANAHFVTL